MPVLDNGEVPVQIWLTNAVDRLEPAGRTEQTCFQRALEKVGARVGQTHDAANADTSFHVSLSHWHADTKSVGELAAKLAVKEKLRVRFDPWELVTGEPLSGHRHPGLCQADSCAICVGGHTSMEWFRTETQRALDRQKTEAGPGSWQQQKAKDKALAEHIKVKIKA